MFRQKPLLSTEWVSPEFKRILALPRHETIGATDDELAFLNEKLTIKGGSCRGCRTCDHKGFMRLRPSQAMALKNCLASQSGAVFLLGAGHGKTLVGFLAPYFYGAQKILYVTEPNLILQARSNYKDLRPHFQYETEIPAMCVEGLTIPTDGYFRHPITKNHYQMQNGKPLLYSEAVNPTKKGDNPAIHWVGFNPFAYPSPNGRMNHIGFFGQITYIPYSKISTADVRALRASFDLIQAKPDIVIFDEAHNIKGKKGTSIRSDRIRAFCEQTPHIPKIFMTGTITSESIEDFSHLMSWGLGAQTPVPSGVDESYVDLRALTNCVDAGKEGKASTGDWFRVKPLDQLLDDNTFATNLTTRENWVHETEEVKIRIIREAMRVNLASAVGVAITEDLSVANIPIVWKKVPVGLPDRITELVTRVEENWTSPDGEEDYILALVTDATIKSLAKGFWMQWAWPEGVKDEAWLTARKDWFSEVRKVLKLNLRGADSPMFLAMIAAQHTQTTDQLRGGLSKVFGLSDIVSVDLEEGDEVDVEQVRTTTFKPSQDFLNAWLRWVPHMAKRKPPTVIHWESTFLIDRLRDWLENEAPNEPVIIWYQSRAFEEALKELEWTDRFTKQRMRMPVYGASSQPPKNPKTCAMSIKVHGTGKQLHLWSCYYALEMPGSARLTEQWLARAHRPGQQRSQVTVYYLQHHDTYIDNLRKVRERAVYLHALVPPQRLIVSCHFEE